MKFGDKAYQLVKERGEYAVREGTFITDDDGKPVYVMLSSTDRLAKFTVVDATAPGWAGNGGWHPTMVDTGVYHLAEAKRVYETECAAVTKAVAAAVEKGGETKAGTVGV